MELNKLEPLDLRLLYEIQKKPRSSKMELCRLLNTKFKYYCGRRSCFANPRKRKHFTIFKNNCQIQLGKAINSLKKLEEKGLIIIRKERKPDGKNNRSWDYMKVSYSTLAVAFGGL